MSSLTELWQIGQAIEQARNQNHPATALNNAVGSFISGRDTAEKKDKEQYDQLERVLRLQEAVRQRDAAARAQAQAEFESRKARGEAIDATAIQDITSAGKFDAAAAGINLNTPTGKILANLLNSGAIAPLDFGKKPVAVEMTDKGTNLKYGTDIDEEVKRSQIAANNALAGKRTAEAKETSTGGPTKYNEILAKHGTLQSNMNTALAAFQKAKKEGTPEDQLQAQTNYTNAQRSYQAFKPTYDAAVKEYDRRLKTGGPGNPPPVAPAQAGKVLVTSPDGVDGYIPAAQLKSAIAQGYKQKKVE